MRTRVRRGRAARFGIPVTAAVAVAGLALSLLTAPAAQAQAVVVINSDFEDGTTQGWAPRADETVAVTAAGARSGAFGLTVTDRTRTWEGPTLNLLGIAETGVRYDFSVWVRLATGEAATQLRMSVERQWQGDANFEQVVGDTTVTDGGWVRLAGSYTLAHQVDFFTVYIESASSDSVSFHIDDFAMSHEPLPPIQDELPDLQDELAPYFPIGASIELPQILGQHGDLLVKHFNSVTPGNALKWDATQPVEGDFRFDDADALIDFATAHGMRIHGHTLVWHNQTPAWVFQDADGNPMTPTEANKQLLLQRLEDHIRTVAGRYAGQIDAWDVVNEVIDENQPDGLRRSPWYEITGLDYIRTAFRVAREVAPDATLLINDYNTNVPAKREALFNLVSQLRAEGVPIDGVGHQMHVNIEWPSVSETAQMLDRFAALGIEQHITEMDMSIYTNQDESFETPPPERLITQGYRYRDFFDLYRDYADEITAVTLWGLADDSTWLDSFPVTRKDAPLLFDVQLQAKPAYWGIVNPEFIENPPTSTPTSPTPGPTSATPTAPGETTSPPEPVAGCQVAYRVVNQWPEGFQGSVTITNTSETTIDGWEAAWSFPDGQQITQLWNGQYAQDGAEVTVTNESYNGTITAGGSTEFGFLASWSGSNRVPEEFTVNGTACSIG